MLSDHLITLINQIPYGKVVSYGQLAEQLCMCYGYNTSGWLVGRMMNSMWKSAQKADNICPRWRVVNKQWEISLLKLWEPWLVQMNHLRDEGIIIEQGRIDMKRYWFRFGEDY